MAPSPHLMTACVTTMAVAVVMMDAVEASSQTTSIGFSASTRGIQYYDEGGNALFINDAFPLVSGRLVQVCFYIHKNFDNDYTGTFFVFKKTDSGYRLIFKENVVFSKTQGRHCVNMTEPPLVSKGQFLGWRYDKEAGPISYTIPDQESGTIVVNNVPFPLVVGQTYGSRTFVKTYFFKVEAIVDIGTVGPLGPVGPRGRAGHSGVTVTPLVMGVADSAGEFAGNTGVPGQKGAPNTTRVDGLLGHQGLTKPQVYVGHAGISGQADDVVATGQAGDAVATGQGGDVVATGQAGDAVATGQGGDVVASGQGGDAVATGQAGDVVATGQGGNVVATGQSGDAVATGQSGDVVAPGQAGDDVATGQEGNVVAPGQAGDVVASGQSGDAVAIGQSGDADASGQSGDADASGQAGDAVATGQSGDAVATGQSGDADASGQAGDGATGGTTGYHGAQVKTRPFTFLGKRVIFADPDEIMNITAKQDYMQCCTDGETGVTGSTGITGVSGTTGYPGLTGLSGTKGDIGMPGVTGTSGQNGLRGMADPTGATGDVGPSGLPGITGPSGPRGPTGITGVSGSLGSTGPVGPSGVSGQTGSIGPAGETSVSGMPGQTGARGDDGATGDKGLRDPDTCKMTPRPCPQICVNTGISHECRCRKGYTLAADKCSCVDIDECITGGPCEQLCHNTVGSFRCSCRPGYNLTVNQRNCEDVDECQHNACPRPKYGVMQICKNTIGSFICIGFGSFFSDLDKAQDNGTHNDFQHEFPRPEPPTTASSLVYTTNVLTILVGCLLGVVLIIVLAVIFLAYKTRKTSPRSPSVYRLHPELYGSRGDLSPRCDVEGGAARTYIQQPYPGMTL